MLTCEYTSPVDSQLLLSAGRSALSPPFRLAGFSVEEGFVQLTVTLGVGRQERDLDRQVGRLVIARFGRHGRGAY
jgi:hypothetical protein